MTENKFIPKPVHILYREMIERIETRSGVPDYPFYLKELDDMTMGVPKGQLSVVAARPSEGKTSFGMQCAIKNAGVGKDVVYITREDNSLKVLEKMCCNIFSIPNTDLRTGDTSTLKRRFPENLLKHFNLLLLDDFGGSFQELEEMLCGNEEHGGLDPMPDIIFIDYIQLIRNKNSFMSRKEVVEDFMRKCKDICNTRGASIVILSQVNRTARNERPTLWQMKESGAIEESADLCLILHYPWKYEVMSGTPEHETQNKKGMVECIIAKQKEGDIGIVKLKFQGQYYRFGNYMADTLDEKIKLNARSSDV